MEQTYSKLVSEVLTAAKMKKDGAKYVGGFAFSIDLRLEQTDGTWWPLARAFRWM